MSDQQPHQDQPVYTQGAALNDAQRAVVLLHGRGSTAESILRLAAHLPQDATAFLAPQAANQTWYPRSGFLPLEANEPHVSSAFQVVADVLARITGAGIPGERIVLGGFSQGACLAAEFVARHPRRYGGLFVLSGALLGPPDMPRAYGGALDSTPVFIGGCDHDPWVTAEQLRLTGRVLQDLGGAVTVDIVPGREHTVRQSEIEQVSRMLSGVRQ